MPEWTEGDTTYRVTGVEEVAQRVRARAVDLEGQMGERWTAATGALEEARGRLAGVLYEQILRTEGGVGELIAQLRSVVAYLDSFPHGGGRAGVPPSPPAIPAPDASASVSSGDPDALARFGRRSEAWEERMRLAAAAVGLDGVSVAKSVRIPVPATPTGTTTSSTVPRTGPLPVAPGMDYTDTPFEAIPAAEVVHLPDVVGPVGRATALSAATARLAGDAARAFSQADSVQQQRAWNGALQRTMLTTERSHGLSREEFKLKLNQFLLEEGRLDGGPDVADWDPADGWDATRSKVAQAYDLYATMAIDFPEQQWLWIGATVSAGLVASMQDLDLVRDVVRTLGGVIETLPKVIRDQIPAASLILQIANMTEEELSFYLTEIMKMQQEIYVDMVIMHEAYQTGGMAGIRALREAGQIDDFAVAAWAKIDRGTRTGDQDLIDAGMKDLLHREQFQIIQDNYDRMRHHQPSGEAFTYVLTIFAMPSILGTKTYAETNPVRVSQETPGARKIGPFDNPFQGRVTVSSGLPAGNLADAEERWKYMEATVIPSYIRQREDDPEELDRTLREPVDERASKERLRNHIGEIIRKLLRLRVDLDQ